MRLVLGIVAGLVAWFVAITAIGFVLHLLAPDVSASLVAHTTAVAMAERLAISFVGSLFGGWLAATIGRGQRAAMITGVLMLIIFVPYHLFGRDMQGTIWTSFPLWYHLMFFVSLPLLAILGGRLTGRR